LKETETFSIAKKGYQSPPLSARNGKSEGQGGARQAFAIAAIAMEVFDRRGREILGAEDDSLFAGF